MKKPKDTKKAPVKRPKAITRGQLVKRLDTAFSQYIRLKDAVNGQARCVTCGQTAPWKEMQNGHFYSRKRFPTRWDEKNCHVQDYRCNIALSGNYIVYTRYMIDRYGREAVDELEKQSLSGEKITTAWIREKIDYYKMKVGELQDERISE